VGGHCLTSQTSMAQQSLGLTAQGPRGAKPGAKRDPEPSDLPRGSSKGPQQLPGVEPELPRTLGRRRALPRVLVGSYRYPACLKGLEAPRCPGSRLSASTPGPCQLPRGPGTQPHALPPGLTLPCSAPRATGHPQAGHPAGNFPHPSLPPHLRPAQACPGTSGHPERPRRRHYRPPRPTGASPLPWGHAAAAGPAGSWPGGRPAPCPRGGLRVCPRPSHGGRGPALGWAGEVRALRARRPNPAGSKPTVRVYTKQFYGEKGKKRPMGVEAAGAIHRHNMIL